jgi:peptidoglycan/LPS O-acetylase OafA/YrhL
MSDYSLESLRNSPLEKGRLAVDLFFILSGFILAHVYGAAFADKNCNVKAFFIARIARIYPAHLAMMIIFLLYVVVLGALGFPYNAERYRPESFLWHVTLLDAWGIDKDVSWNLPAWSIGAEFAAYIAFPFLIGPIMRLSPRTASRCLLVLVGAFSLLIQPLHLTERTFDFSIARVLPEFLIGVLAYRARDHLIAWAGNVNITFSGAIAFLIVCVVAMAPDALIVAGLVIVIVCGAAITGSLATALSWRPLLYLGEISYSLYLVHAFVLSATYSAFKIPRIAAYVPASLRDVLVIALVLWSASVLYHFVEKPGRAFICNAFAFRPRRPAENAFVRVPE